MKKTLGIFLVFIAICLVMAFLEPTKFLSTMNIENLLLRLGIVGLIALGVSLVIITGGIDLSLGSVICLTGCGLPWLLVRQGWSPASALFLLFAVCLAIGLIHGLLITKWNLQPFIITLCGLLIYRGTMRGLAADQSQGFRSGFDDLRWIATGKMSLPFSSMQVPIPFLLLLAVAAVVGGFLRYTVWGQHLIALGNNEEAARCCGIRTHRIIIATYVACSLLAGLAGILLSMDVNSAQPSDFGNFYELYAIAAAVLGGCSLRGGRGAVVGVLIGSSLILVIRNMIVLLFPRQNTIEFAVIGFVILLGVMGDEIMARLFVKKSSR